MIICCKTCCIVIIIAWKARWEVVIFESLLWEIGGEHRKYDRGVRLRMGIWFVLRAIEMDSLT